MPLPVPLKAIFLCSRSAPVALHARLPYAVNLFHRGTGVPSAVRIGTGRRHQFRTHINHFGHASVLDAKYTPDVWETEALTLYHRLLNPKACLGALPSQRFKTFLGSKTCGLPCS